MRKRLVILLLIAALLSALFCMPASASGTGYDTTHPENLNDADLNAVGAILIEANTGMVVYEKNADAPMYPASTTKILTTYLGILLGDMDQTVVTSNTALQVEADSSKIPLAAGEEINFKDLLYATMVKSGNEGANLIAETVGGSIENFVEIMNQYAASLGCVNTHFANPNGMPAPDNYSTASDLARLARYAMRDSLFAAIVGMLIGVLAQLDVKKVLFLGVTMGAVMELIPRITSLS